MRIFSHGFDSEAADLFQRRTTNHRAGATEKGGVPVIVTLLDRAVEQGAFVRDIFTQRQVTLERIGRIKVVRRLQQSQFRVLKEAPDGGLEENTGGNVVAVKNANQLPFGEFQRVVKVARFRVGVVRSGDIAHASIGGKNRKLPPLTVVQQIDVELIFRVINALRGEHRIAHHVQAFVIGRNINIYRRPQGNIVRQRNNAPL